MMGAQTARDALFPTTCAHCGGSLSEPVNFCPKCGAQTRPKSGERAPKRKPDDAFGTGLWASRQKPLSGSPGAAPYREVHPASALRRIVDHRGLKAGIALMLVAMVVIAGTVMLLHRQDDLAKDEQQGASNTVQGSVTADGASQSRQISASTAADRASTAQKNTVASIGASGAAAAPAATPQNAQSPSSLSQRDTTSSSDSSGSTRSDSKNQRLMALALARAHSGLEKNDLRMARSGVFWALSLQHDNSEALMLKQELLSRERGRNSPSNASRSSVDSAGTD